MKGKVTAVLFIVVFLLIVAVICTFLTGQSLKPNNAEATEAPSGSAVITVVDPTAAAETSRPVSTPVSTPAATAKPTPTATPVPTATPTPTASVTQTSLDSGSFSSATNAKLNIRADWSAQTAGSSQVEVTVKVSLDSYSIHLQAVPYSVNINLGGQYISLDAPAIDYDGNAMINTPLAEKTFTVDLAEGSSTKLTLAVEWHFGGTYGGVELPVIECGGTIDLSR